MESHAKTGKSFKNDLLQREKDFEEIELNLIVLLIHHIIIIERSIEIAE